MGNAGVLAVKVKVEFIVESPDYGEKEFRREIELLLEDIDPVNTRLIDFKMYELKEARNEKS